VQTNLVQSDSHVKSASHFPYPLLPISATIWADIGNDIGTILSAAQRRNFKFSLRPEFENLHFFFDAYKSVSCCAYHGAFV